MYLQMSTICKNFCHSLRSAARGNIGQSSPLNIGINIKYGPESTNILTKVLHNCICINVK